MVSEYWIAFWNISCNGIDNRYGNRRTRFDESIRLMCSRHKYLLGNWRPLRWNESFYKIEKLDKYYKKCLQSCSAIKRCSSWIAFFHRCDIFLSNMMFVLNCTVLVRDQFHFKSCSWISLQHFVIWICNYLLQVVFSYHSESFFGDDRVIQLWWLFWSTLLKFFPFFFFFSENLRWSMNQSIKLICLLRLFALT